MKNLRLLRNNKGLSLKEFGGLIGVSESTVSLYENGKRQPDFVTLIKIADFFDVTIDYLLGRATKVEKKPLSNDKGNELVRLALKDTGLLEANGELSEEGGKLIADFIRSNADMLKRMLQMTKQERE